MAQLLRHHISYLLIPYHIGMWPTVWFDNFTLVGQSSCLVGQTICLVGQVVQLPQFVPPESPITVQVAVLSPPRILSISKFWIISFFNRNFFIAHFFISLLCLQIFGILCFVIQLHTLDVADIIYPVEDIEPMAVEQTQYWQCRKFEYYISVAVEPFQTFEVYEYDKGRRL